MNIFIVTREGVYRHQICGVFTDVKNAIGIAQNLANAEDGYHDFYVLKGLLGHQTYPTAEFEEEELEVVKICKKETIN